MTSSDPELDFKVTNCSTSKLENGARYSYNYYGRPIVSRI